jgi:hypothetical protein
LWETGRQRFTPLYPLRAPERMPARGAAEKSIMRSVM